MKAVGFYEHLPVDNMESLIDLELAKPQVSGRDLLVEVKAVSVNPVDTKVRGDSRNKGRLESPRILGWDAAGVVEAVGSDVTLFKAGDEVYYAGDITRAGSNSEYQLVDERIVGSKPKSLSFAEAAALPLTSITAWEGLFERLGVKADGSDKGKSLVIIGGAGGVGSVVIQLAKHAGLTVIATASREESRSWVKQLGADHVISHREPIPEQIHALGFDFVDYIYTANSTTQHWKAIAEMIRPQGQITSIVETGEPLNLDFLKNKSAGFSWEFMFTRSMFQTEDMSQQHELLNELSTLIDEGRLRTTLTETLSPIGAATLREAHALVERGRMVGKVVVETFT